MTELSLHTKKAIEMAINSKTDLVSLQNVFGVLISADPNVKILEEKTLNFANAHLQKILMKQERESLKEKGLYALFNGPEILKRGGLTYLTWSGQFKVSGITVVRNTEQISDKVGFKNQWVGIHHDAEYTIQNLGFIEIPKRSRYNPLEVSLFELNEIPTDERIKKIAREKAIRYEFGC